ncbi:MAG: hypothetical protein BWY04_00528 [candidate division CPR1 bacterium ADurb.Bin160]|uniref:Uncharacterized protein n=1 Tax=candidate division CPR1 bacterium ADurb.Bin160 TaxID=1852826 RepID=A0A1V5ZNV5_9BACT|nr:MAG: hypothetical protein BWY04_00528 [candidate division CPR1 bacterium ADurb.Bin160]
MINEGFLLNPLTKGDPAILPRCLSGASGGEQLPSMKGDILLKLDFSVRSLRSLSRNDKLYINPSTLEQLPLRKGDNNFCPPSLASQSCPAV